MAHHIGFYVPPRHLLLDLAGPLDAFDAANAAAERQLYRWRILSRAGGLMTSGAGLPIKTRLADDAALDTLLVIGGAIDAMRREDEIATVRRLAGRVTRIASICTGAILLAGAGLLDGRRATTHWSRARELQESFPAVSVEADRIYVADGPVWTSAGITAGIDLALALIEADHGVELARRVSRELVVYHRRPGGQSQFSALSQMKPDSDRMRILSESLPIERLADAARFSPRQFGRAFRRRPGDPRQGDRAVAHRGGISTPSERIGASGCDCARGRVQRPRADASGVRDPLWATSANDTTHGASALTWASAAALPGLRCLSPHHQPSLSPPTA